MCHLSPPKKGGANIESLKQNEKAPIRKAEISEHSQDKKVW